MRKEYTGTGPSGRARRRRSRRRGPSVWGLLMGAVILAAGVVLSSVLGEKLPEETGRADKLAAQTRPPETEEPVLSLPPEVPDWVRKDLLPVNEYSRPGTALEQVNGVVVHYVGNPSTTAEQNRSYFANLAQTHETWASSHFLIGIDGTVIQCVPLDEIAYCSTIRNEDTVSIECCHPDDGGEFTEETMASLVRLLDWLISTYRLEREDVIRHYDVAGKECPRYYVRHPEAWEDILDALTFA